MNTIGARVAYVRSARQWSQAELARRIGVRPQTIQQIENNRTRRSRYLPDIARVTGVQLEWLLTGTGCVKTGESATVEPVPLEDLVQHFANAVAAAFARGGIDADTLDLLERLLDKLTHGNR